MLLIFQSHSYREEQSVYWTIGSWCRKIAIKIQGESSMTASRWLYQVTTLFIYWNCARWHKSIILAQIVSINFLYKKIGLNICVIIFPHESSRRALCLKVISINYSKVKLIKAYFVEVFMQLSMELLLLQREVVYVVIQWNNWVIIILRSTWASIAIYRSLSLSTFYKRIILMLRMH